MNFPVTQVIDSYKNQFTSSLGAYLYMYLNQEKPEFFSLSSLGDNSISETMENICKNATSFTDVSTAIKNLPDVFFSNVQSENEENNLSKNEILKVIRNIGFLDIEWDKPHSWNNLTGLVEFNNFSLFLEQKEKQKIQNQLAHISETYNMKKLALNPNFNPDDFIEKFQSGLNQLCTTLELNPQQIGLGFLEVNYKTENGDFTGYMGYINNHFSSKMVINKLEVFTHEWMHFIESSLGYKGHSLTGLMGLLSVQDMTSLLPEFKTTNAFSEVLSKKEEKLEHLNFPQAIKSASHFFERYALDKENFYINIEKIAQHTMKEINSDNLSPEIYLDMQKSIEKLLNPSHPTRYFSFLKAQCELEIERHLNNNVEHNQFLDFSKKADRHLKQNDYTASLIETFARSFESFVFEKSSHCEVLAKSYDSDFYPQGKTRSHLHDFWEKSWVEIKSSLDRIEPKEPCLKSKAYSVNNISVLRKQIQESSPKSKYNI